MTQESPDPEICDAVVVLPVLNEADYVVDAVNDLRGGNSGVLIWVMDGGSVDGTIDLVRGMTARDAQLHLFDNPGGSQSHAMNLAAQMAADAGYRIMVRADAHCRYPAEFVQGVIRLLTNKVADSVTVPLIATQVAYTRWQLANGELQRSWLGNGGARHRQLGQSGWVDHGHHAAFLVDRFLAVGGYDNNLCACEDVDYDHRQQIAGGRIWFAVNWPVVYMPRANPRATWQQMLRNGRARMQVALKHRRRLNRRQLLPVVALTGLICAPLGLLWWPAVLPAMCYLALVTALALRIGRKGGVVHSMRIAALAVTSHAGFGAGVLRVLMGRMKRGAPV